MKLPRILVIAGSDSGGGAGIQADIKTVTALGGYAMTAITAITAQNTLGVESVYAVPVPTVLGQIRSVLDDIGADIIKIGMLHDERLILAIADELEKWALPIVLDPVMVAKGGATLLKTDAIDALKERLIPMADILTPNIPEAQALTGLPIVDEASLHRCGKTLVDMGAETVVMKGGHYEEHNNQVKDWIITSHSTQGLTHPRIRSRHTHGTGCTLASAIATFLAKGHTVNQSVQESIRYVQHVLRHAPGLGHGHGPLGHHIPFIQGKK